jgi:hypothetical protein
MNEPAAREMVQFDACSESGFAGAERVHIARSFTLSSFQ